MRHRTKAWLIAIVLIGLVACLGLVGLHTMGQKMQIAAVDSSCCAIYAHLASLDTNTLTEVGVKPDNSWRELSAVEYDALLKAHPNSHGYDSRLDSSGLPRDPWGERFHCFVRLRDSGELDWRVFSSGPDRQLKTGDDIGAHTQEPMAEPSTSANGATPRR